MIVIAVVGILAMVTVPKYQALTDHYHLESSSQVVAVQLRNAKQYAQDRRTDVYVMFNFKTVQTFYLNNSSHGYVALENPQQLDSGVIFKLESQGVKDIPTTSADGSAVNYIPLYDKCLVFDRKGFLQVSPVSIILTNARTPQQSVSINLTSDNLAVKITWQ